MIEEQVVHRVRGQAGQQLAYGDTPAIHLIVLGGAGATYLEVGVDLVGRPVNGGAGAIGT